jgi:hypothetical protein
LRERIPAASLPVRHAGCAAHLLDELIEIEKSSHDSLLRKLLYIVLVSEGDIIPAICKIALCEMSISLHLYMALPVYMALPAR